MRHRAVKRRVVGNLVHAESRPSIARAGDNQHQQPATGSKRAVLRVDCPFPRMLLALHKRDPDHLSTARLHARTCGQQADPSLAHQTCACAEQSMFTKNPTRLSSALSEGPQSGSRSASVGPDALIIRRRRDQRATRSGAHDSPATIKVCNGRSSGRTGSTTQCVEVRTHQGISKSE
jgi:hypothetical protein